MVPFANLGHVRLRSRWHGAYLYADEDMLGVSLRLSRASTNAVWVVQHVVRANTCFVLLRSAAYHRYLAVTLLGAQASQGAGRTGRVVQCINDSPEQDDVLWETFEAEDGSGDYLLRHRRYGPWRNYDQPELWMSWIAEAVPPREEPPIRQLPLRAPIKRRRRIVLGPLLRRRTHKPSAVRPRPRRRPRAGASALEYFPDRAHVRLRNSMNGCYLYADADGVGISVRLDRTSLNTAWAVHQVVRHGVTYVLLHGAAYGRYLALWQMKKPEPEYSLHQSVYTTPGQEDILWEATVAEDGNVRIRHASYSAYSLDLCGLETNTWVVESIPPRAAPPALPPPSQGQEGYRRKVVLLRANHEGQHSFFQEFEFNGRSVYKLREIIAVKLNKTCTLNITLCVSPGVQGRLTPLSVDLAANNDPMVVVVLATGSPAAQALVYPDVDAQ